jgi:GTP-binding protein EngB required for normal cell division
MDLGSPYERYLRDIRLLQVYAENRSHISPKTESLKLAFKELDGLVALLSRKPNLCFLGEFDAGKSTLANILMNAERLPARIAPHTAMPTVVRHINDRADWMRDEVYFVDTFLAPVNWDNQKAIETHLVAKGPIEYLHKATHKKGTGKGKKAPEEFARAHMALAYVDSPLLQTCNLVDFPGYGHDEHDEENAQRFETLADIVIYLSPIHGFLNSTLSDRPAFYETPVATTVVLPSRASER